MGTATAANNAYRMEPVNIYQWVNDHNPPPNLSYSKGWWDNVTFLYRLAELYGRNRVMVVSTYEMITPPPQETLLMPVVRLETDRVTFIIKMQFSAIDPAWTVSVIRHSAGRIPLFSLINEQEEFEADKIDGFATDWIFPNYAKSLGRLTGRVDDDWQLYALIWVLTHS